MIGVFKKSIHTNSILFSLTFVEIVAHDYFSQRQDQPRTSGSQKAERWLPRPRVLYGSYPALRCIRNDCGQKQHLDRYWITGAGRSQGQPDFESGKAT